MAVSICERISNQKFQKSQNSWTFGSLKKIDNHFYFALFLDLVPFFFFLLSSSSAWELVLSFSVCLAGCPCHPSTCRGGRSLPLGPRSSPFFTVFPASFLSSSSGRSFSISAGEARTTYGWKYNLCWQKSKLLAYGVCKKNRLYLWRRDHGATAHCRRGFHLNDSYVYHFETEMDIKTQNHKITKLQTFEEVTLELRTLAEGDFT